MYVTSLFCFFLLLLLLKKQQQQQHALHGNNFEMAYLGEKTLYITPLTELFMAPFSYSPSLFSSSSLSSSTLFSPLSPTRVSVTLTNYRMRISHVVAKSRSPVDLALTLIESVSHARSGGFSWLAVKSKMTLAFCLVAPHTASSRIDDANPAEVIVNLMHAIKVAMPGNFCDLFAFKYFNALKKKKKKCSTDKGGEGLNVNFPYNVSVTKMYVGRKNTTTDAGVGLTRSSSCWDQTTDEEEDGEEEEEKEFGAHNNSMETMPTFGDLVMCMGDNNDEQEEEEGEEPMRVFVGGSSISTVRSMNDVAALSARTTTGGGCRPLPMRRSASVVVCGPTKSTEVVPPTVCENCAFSCVKEKECGVTSSFRGGHLTSNIDDGCSIAEGVGLQCDSSWYAYSLVNDFRRMSHLPQLHSRLGSVSGSRTPDAAPSLGLGVDVSPWFRILPLTRGDLFTTYPFAIIVPRRVTASLAERVAQYRHKGRIPSISWIHLETGASISRAAQPGSGSYMSSDADALFCSFLNPSFQQPQLQLQAVAQRVAESTPGENVAKECALRMKDHFISPNCSGNTDRLSPGERPGSINKQQPAAALDAKTGLCEAKMKTACDWSQCRSTMPKPPSLFSVDENAADLSQVASERGRLHIIDCRSRAAAAANFTTGGGYELVRAYDSADIQFLSLGNIHAVRTSFEKLRKLCVSIQGHEMGCAWDRQHPSGFYFFTRLDATGWPDMIVKIIWSSWIAAEHVVAGDSVLVHCTDGWDRTPQVVSLAMIQLDGYYRTIEGFCVLIMREWLELGHRFAERCAHNLSRDNAVALDVAGEDVSCAAAGLTKKGRQTSPNVGNAVKSIRTRTTLIAPVFAQFIDAVYQLLRLFPTDFEFTPHFLQYLLDEVYNCRFGTFLYNSHRARYQCGGVTHRTMSLWGEVAELLRLERKGVTRIPANEKLLNPFYISLDTHLAHASQDSSSLPRSRYLLRRLVPTPMSCRYNFWHSHYCRYSFTESSNGVGLELDHLSPLIDVWLWHNSVQAKHKVQQQQQGEEEEEDVEDWVKSDVLGGTFSNRTPSFLCRNGGCRGLLDVAEKSDMPSITSVATAAITSYDASGSRMMLSVPLSLDSASIATITSNGEGDGGSESVRSGSRDIGRRQRVKRSPFSISSTLEVPRKTAFCDNDITQQDQKVYYIPRSTSKTCEVCGALFTFFFRRHTCRHCCCAVCSRCGGQFLRLPSSLICLYEERDATRPVRVCTMCYGKVVYRVTTARHHV